jgi:4,5-dihydroxyphthalate decarboxylase
MTNLKLTAAIKHYDRHLGLLEGKVKAEGLDLTFIPVTVEQNFHHRMLWDREWDVSELSLSHYLMAKSRGLGLVAIPIFPRRLFSQSQMYISNRSEIARPRDLIEKRIGLGGGYGQTLAVLAKGDLEYEYGVPLKQVTWVTNADEIVPFHRPPWLRLERAPRNIETMLIEGEVQALMASMIPRTFLAGASEISRLFKDPHNEEMTYFRRTGFFPIMHVIAVKEEVLAKEQWVAESLFKAFEESKEMAYRYYNDPNWSYISGVSVLVHEEKAVLGHNPWPNGVTQNRKYLEWFVQLQFEQGLIDRKLDLEEIFAENTLAI